MKEYRLLLIIKAMSKADIREARKFLKADYFKWDPLVLSLFNQLVRFHPDMKGALIDEQKLYKKLFPKNAFDEQKLRRIRSKLKTALEEFLAFQNWRSSPLHYHQDLAEAYRHRRGSQLFKWTQKKAIKHLDINMLDGLKRQQELTNIKGQLYFHPHTGKLDSKRGDRWFSGMVGHAEQSYLLGILQMVCEMQVIKRADKSVPSQFMLAAASAILNIETIPSSPLIRLYVDLYHSFLEPTSLEQFEQIRMNLIALHNAGETAFYDLALAYKVLVNQMDFLVKRGAPARQILFSLLEEGIRLGLYLEEGQLSYNRYFNIVMTMLLYEEFAQAKSFILQFQDHLLIKDRESAVNLALAYWYYQNYLKNQDTESLEEAWSRTHWVTNRQLTFELRFRSIRLRILFDLFLLKRTDRFELQKEIRNIQHFLKERRGFSRRHSYGRLVYWIQKLATWKNKAHPSLSQLQAYQLQIENYPEHIELKPWLLKKIKSMIEAE